MPPLQQQRSRHLSQRGQRDAGGYRPDCGRRPAVLHQLHLAIGCGQSITNKRLFELDIDGDIPTGTYHGTAAIYGGGDADAQDNQAQQDFAVQVVAKDTAPPETTITGGPDESGQVCVNTATFTFTFSDDVTPTDH